MYQLKPVNERESSAHSYDYNGQLSHRNSGCNFFTVIFLHYKPIQRIEECMGYLYIHFICGTTFIYFFSKPINGRIHFPIRDTLL